jgi:hypothetical protein
VTTRPALRFGDGRGRAKSLAPSLHASRASAPALTTTRAYVEDNVMSRSTMASQDVERETAVKQQLEAAWLDIERTLATVADDGASSSEAVLPPATAPVLDGAPGPSAASSADAGPLVHERHDSSALFLASTLRELLTSGARPVAAAPSRPAESHENVAETFVPIAVSTGSSRRDLWLCLSVGLATVGLVFFLAVAIHLFVGGR